MNSLTASLPPQFCYSAAKFPVRSCSLFIHSPLTHRNNRRFVCMAEPYLITKLESAEKTWEDLSVKLADPGVASNPSEYRKLAQSLAELDEVVSTFRRFKDCEKQLEETKALAKATAADEDMVEMISSEIEALNYQIMDIEERLKVLLLPTDPLDASNIMLEVRAGAGGDKAGLWAGDLVAALAQPYHHRRRQLSCFLPPDSIFTLISRAWFLRRQTPLSSSIWTSSKHTRTSLGTLMTHCSPSPTPSTSEESGVPTAESCVNLGLSLFAKGRVKDALTQFDTALTLNPNLEEAQAALYNKACCHAYRGEGNKAADCLRTALREYDLKFGTILNDPDLASFRALPEFKELQEEARLGGEDIGYGFRRDLKLISEVQAPFRGVRRFFYVAFMTAAGISLLFTIPRLLRAIQGGDGAPDLWETSGNAAINIGGIVVLVTLLLWDNKKEEEQIAQITRDETLSRLPLYLSTNRIVELVQLRDTARPVILAGNKETIALALKKAERFRTELLSRGVILVPVIWGEEKEPKIAKKGFGLSPKAGASLPSIGEEFDNRTQSVVAKSKLKAEIRFKAEVVSPVEWERWIKDQQKSEGLTPGEDVYVLLRLDGRVRKSGRGMPDWQKIVKQLPPMEAFLSKIER